MTDMEVDRIMRIMVAHNEGHLNDVALYQMFAATKAETLLRERERITEWLDERARAHVALGQLTEARALAATADALRLQRHVAAPVLETDLNESDEPEAPGRAGA